MAPAEKFGLGQRFVAICALFGDLWAKKVPFCGIKKMTLIGLRIGKCAFVLSKNKDWWICNCGCAKELIMRETTTVAR